MTKEGLNFINSSLESIIPYEFEEWTEDLTFPFWTGEFSSIPVMNEDGLKESTFILTGTTTNSMEELLDGAEKVEDMFPVTGTTAILDSGSGIAVSYSNCSPVPTGETGLKRLQINLNISEWRI